jgi:type II secretory ATPase GspE/PulE/Tfp pilus assembly ATPase PilB-like protein
VVQARRLCLGNLPGFEALRQRRAQLIPRQGEASDLTITDDTLSRLSRQRWHQLEWSRRDDGTQSLDSLCLRANGLVAITGPSGSGKTTLLDRICGLLREEDSHWQLICEGGAGR